MNTRIYSELRNYQIFSELNIFGPNYLNIFEYPNIRDTLDDDDDGDDDDGDDVKSEIIANEQTMTMMRMMTMAMTMMINDSK